MPWSNWKIILKSSYSTNIPFWLFVLCVYLLIVTFFLTVVIAKRQQTSLKVKIIRSVCRSLCCDVLCFVGFLLFRFAAAAAAAIVFTRVDYVCVCACASQMIVVPIESFCVVHTIHIHTHVDGV